MSSSFDWTQFEEEPQETFDWNRFEEDVPPSKSLSGLPSGRPGLLVKAGRTLKKDWKKLTPELPVAGLQALEAPAHLPQLVAKAASGFLGEPSKPQHEFSDWRANIPVRRGKLPSELVAEKVREGYSEEEKEGAQAIADLMSMVMPVPLGKEIGTRSPDLMKARLSPPKQIRGTEKFDSGLTKPRAVKAAHPQRAIVTPGAQEKLIKGLEREASGLVRESASKHIPAFKQIEEGVEFFPRYRQEVGELKAMAERFNPEIDITPLSKFIGEKVESFRGIPRPHEDARMILRDLKSFRRNPPQDLKSLYRTLRSNNRKRERIFERARIHGKLKEYDSFLAELNNSIIDSIRSTLPKDSAWLNKLESTNKQFHDYMNGQEVMRKLEPILGKDIDTASFRKLAHDQAKQKKLLLHSGKKGGEELIQIAKDLDEAVNAVKSMTAKEWSKFDEYLGLSFLIPGVKKISIPALLVRAPHYARRAYGYWLSRPSKIKYYDDALKAIASKDLDSYKMAAEKLKEPD